VPHFFAKFRQVEEFWIRHDTRIYLSDFTGTPVEGTCVGAIIGKNPGSATAKFAGWGELQLAGDKLLPNVRNILLKAYDRAGKTPPANAYFQVLNLFYICSKNLPAATAILRNQKNIFLDPVEQQSFNLLWIAWGGKSAILDPLKKRFVEDRPESKVFFYSPTATSTINRFPGDSELAKHPQGMPHAPVIGHLAARL